MKRIILTIFVMFMCSNAWAATWYVRVDGGTRSQCTGLADAVPSGPSASGESCAFAHPYYALGWYTDDPSGGTAGVVLAGDTVVIKPGSYKMGYGGAPGITGCSTSWAYGCTMRPPPNNVTITGCTTNGCGCSSSSSAGIWTTTCTTTRPELWGSGRAKQVINVTSKSGVTLRDLEITDHADCGEGHRLYGCGPADVDELSAARGLTVTSATNLVIDGLNIHGVRSAGIKGWNANGVSFIDSDISYNSFIGIDNDSSGTCTNCGWSGTTSFLRTRVDGNGCVEDNPGNGTIKSEGCYSQDQSGYGDGLGFANTGGTWVITDSSFSHNVSDGLDLLYMNRGIYSGGTLSVKRSRFEGNAGNQIKIPNASSVEDSAIIGNCGYFRDQTFTQGCYASTACTGGVCCFNNCRAFGTPVVLTFKSGDTTTPKLYSNTILSNGDVGIQIGGTCPSGTDAYIYNNILIGGWEFGQLEKSDLFYLSESSTCNADYVENFNLCDDQWKNSECNGANDQTVTTANVKFTGTISQGTGQYTGYYTSNDYISQLTVQATSPAVNQASESTPSDDDTVDFNNFERGASTDIGAFEFGTTGQGGGAASCSAQTINNCDLVLTVSGNSDGACATGYSGTCSYSCTDGVWSLSSNTCTIDTCGNASLDTGEDCDTSGPLLNGQTCCSLGFSCDPADANLACTASTCVFNTSGCAAITCGDNYTEGTEQCDGGVTCSSVCETINPNYENFADDYTETDTPGTMDVFTHKVQMTGITHSADSSVKKDFGASYFGDFTHRFKVQIDSCQDNGAGENGGAALWALATASYGDLTEMETAGDGIALKIRCFSSVARNQWELLEFE